MKIINLYVDRDEVWPVYSLFEPHANKKPNCQVPEEIYKKYLQVKLEHENMQKILASYYGEASYEWREEIKVTVP